MLSFFIAYTWSAYSILSLQLLEEGEEGKEQPNLRMKLEVPLQVYCANISLIVKLAVLLFDPPLLTAPLAPPQNTPTQRKKTKKAAYSELLCYALIGTYFKFCLLLHLFLNCCRR
jgi:hypothetical protein